MCTLEMVRNMALFSTEIALFCTQISSAYIYPPDKFKCVKIGVFWAGRFLYPESEKGVLVWWYTMEGTLRACAYVGVGGKFYIFYKNLKNFLFFIVKRKKYLEILLLFIIFAT